jgi:hypothetical protein
VREALTSPGGEKKNTMKEKSVAIQSPGSNKNPFKKPPKNKENDPKSNDRSNNISFQELI